MLPNALTLRNYRSFASPVRLELRPITLLFGINNSGKSALLRALPLVSDSVAATASGPLDLESPAARGSSFQDLRWKGIEEDEDPDLGLTLEWGPEADDLQVDFGFTWFDEWRRLIIRRFSLRNGLGRSALEAGWQPRPEDRSTPDLTYEVRSDRSSAATVRLGFRGLVPIRWPEGHGPLFEPARKLLLGLGNQVQWLNAARRPPDRIVAYPSAPRWRMKADGSDAAAVLAASPELLSEVSAWYEQHLSRSLRLQEVPPSDFRLTLRNTFKAALDTDLGDNGEGLIQVLPVLTALALSRLPAENRPTILAIEEPESHLHPSLQRALAEHLCETAAQNRAVRIVLESHSEHLLLGIQHAILSGRLDPEDALIYWVRQLDGGQSIAERVTLDQDARLQGAWPPGVFADDTEVARKIVLARRERAAS